MNILMRYPGGVKKAVTFSYDDGTIYDKRLVEIFDKYKMKATFNLNSGRICNNPEKLIKSDEIKDLYFLGGHEIAVHGVYHTHLQLMQSNCITVEMLNDRIALEKLTGKIIRGMAYAYGEYSEDVIASLKASGIVYGRIVAATHNFYLPKNWHTLEPTCHHNDESVFELCEKYVEKDDMICTMFYIWGHSYEFNDDNNWDRIEKICELLANKDDIWYANNIEIYDYVTAFQRLEISCDSKIIHNPNAIDVWVGYARDRKEETFCIRAGETIYL